jgi:hypothetical protein
MKRVNQAYVSLPILNYNHYIFNPGKLGKYFVKFKMEAYRSENKNPV